MSSDFYKKAIDAKVFFLIIISVEKDKILKHFQIRSIFFLRFVVYYNYGILSGRKFVYFVQCDCY